MKALTLSRVYTSLASLLLLVAVAHAAGAEGAIVVQNHYFPKPGLEQEVLKTRLKASEVRRELGLEVGRVLLRTSAVDGHAYVVWECDYPSIEAREKDAAAAENAPTFRAVQERMRPLIARFDRVVWKVEALPKK
jgi:hypothetical protein